MGLESNNDLVPTSIITRISEIVQSMICYISTDEVNALESIEIYPNPVHNDCAQINAGTNQQLSYSVHNSVGKLIERYDNSYLNEICLPDQAGIYYITISDNYNNRIVKKLVKF